jgi:hypothetical protein
MTESKNLWMWISAALLCTTIIASFYAINFQSKNILIKEDYEALLSDIEDLTVRINLLIDYGEGNIVWFNDTRVPLDVNLLKATEILADIEFSTSEFGSFVTKINGVGEDPKKFWLWYYYKVEDGSWNFGPSAADLWILHDGDILAWRHSSV